MHLELVETLRCPRSHAASVLVAASDHTSLRYVMQGVLGCPECGAEYLISNGVTSFDDTAASGVTPGHSEPDAALRVAAQLGMQEGRAVYALVGFSAGVIMQLRELVPARLLLVNTTHVDQFGDASLALSSAPAGVVQCAGLLPLVPGKFDGVAFAAVPDPSLLGEAVDLLKAGARLVAPATCSIPTGISELVRDEREWIATRDNVASAPVGITRRAAPNS